MPHSEQTQRNIAALREANRLWNESKASPEGVECWVRLFHPQGTLTSAAGGARNAEFTAPRTSREGARAYLNGLTGAWAMNYHHMDNYIAEGDRIVVIGDVSWTHRATGKTVSSRKVDICRFDADGMMIGFEEFYDTAALAAAATPD